MTSALIFMQAKGLFRSSSFRNRNIGEGIALVSEAYGSNYFIDGIVSLTHCYNARDGRHFSIYNGNPHSAQKHHIMPSH